MPTMRKVLSEVSITDMILANTMIRKSESMISLPEALANTIENLNCNESKLFNKALHRSHAQILSCDPTGNQDHVNAKRRSSIGRNQLPSTSVTNDQPPTMRSNRQQPELCRCSTSNSAITADSRYSSKGTHSKDTRSPSPSTGRRRKSRIIKKMDMSTLLARAEPIPKWITIAAMDIHSPIPGRPVAPKPLKQESEQQMPSRLSLKPSEFAVEHNLMPLAELAKVICDESNEVFANGLFQPTKKFAEVETIEPHINCKSSLQ
jgi:hypothetical protein